MNFQKVFCPGKVLFLLGVLVTALLPFALNGTAEAGFYTGQSFNAPMENGTTYGHYINDNFNTVTGVIWGSALMKAGFFMVILFTIIRIGFRTPGGLKEAGVYLIAVVLLAAPIYNGKSLLLNAADASDSLTLSIVNQMGGLNYQFAGSAVAVMMAQSQITNEVMHKWRNEAWYFRRDCYNVYNAKLTADAPRQDPFAIDYGDMSLDPLTVFWNVDLSMSVLRCNDYRDKLASSMKDDFNTRLDNFKTDLGSDSNRITLSPQDQQQLDNLSSVTGAELGNKVVYTYDHKPEDEKQPGLLDSLWRAISTRQGLANLVMIMPRLAIASTGIFFVYIFNYYIFQLVTVIKMVAAIGMALGVLYYMFFRKLELPLAALGIWVFGNGWYILAAIGMNQYWKTMLDTPSPSMLAQVLLGTQGAVTNGLFAVGLVGLMGSILAGVLSWKGIAMSMHHAPGVQQAQRTVGGLGGGKSGGGGGAKTGSGGTPAAK